MASSSSGKKISKSIKKIQKKTTARYQCPSCSRTAIKRVSSGVWECKKCTIKYASGTYDFR